MNNTSQTSPKIDLEQLLRDGNIIRIKPQGYSMYPLFIPGRDEALIQQISSTDCRRNDVVLYRRDWSILVLHRIDKITEEGFFMVGDNQWEIEGPLRSDQIIGKLVAFVRNGREISAQNPFYRFLSSVWLLHFFAGSAEIQTLRLTEEFLFPGKFLPHFSHPRKPRMLLSHIRFQPSAPVLQYLLPDLHGYK